MLHRWLIVGALAACGDKDPPDDTDVPATGGTDVSGTGTGTGVGTGTGSVGTGSGTGTGTGTPGTGTGVGLTDTGTTGSTTDTGPDTGTSTTFTGCASAPHIQRRIDATPIGGTLEICDGTHVETLTIRWDLGLHGSGSGRVTLDGDGDGTVITVLDGAELDLVGLTITGGYEFRAGPERDGVGAIDAAAATSLSLDDVVVSANFGDAPGVVGPVSGQTTIAASVIQSNAGGTSALRVHSATLSGVTIADNRGALGGGISAMSGGTVTADASTLITGNDGGRMGGGVLLLADETWTGGVISHNEADVGGGIAILYAGGATLTDVQISDNDAMNGAGLWSGALPVGGPIATLTRVSFQNNIAVGDGGGMLWSGGSTLVLDAVTFTANNADDGGALYLDAINVVDAAFRNGTLFADNTAVAGAAIYVSNGTMLLDDVTLRHNTANRHGGAIALWGTASLECVWCDFGYDLDDNAPDDISIDALAARDDLREETIGTCDAWTGLCDLDTYGDETDTGLPTDTGTRRSDTGGTTP